LAAILCTSGPVIICKKYIFNYRQNIFEYIYLCQKASILVENHPKQELPREKKIPSFHLEQPSLYLPHLAPSELTKI
jgi:hypothetical protein